MRRALPWAVTALGLAPAVAGVAVFWRENLPGTVTHGAGYAPLLPTDRASASSLELTFDRAEVLWTTGHLAGAGLLVAGALVLSGVAGWALGRRSARAGA